jgi:hypothetical protein
MPTTPCAFCGVAVELHFLDLIPKRTPYPIVCPACGGKNWLSPKGVLVSFGALLSCMYIGKLAANVMKLEGTWATALVLSAGFMFGWPIAVWLGRRSARLVRWPRKLQ